MSEEPYNITILRHELMQRRVAEIPFRVQHEGMHTSEHQPYQEIRRNKPS